MIRFIMSHVCAHKILYFMVLSNYLLFYSSYSIINPWFNQVFHRLDYHNNLPRYDNPKFGTLHMVKTNKDSWNLVSPQKLTYEDLEKILFRADIMSGDISKLDVIVGQKKGEIMVNDFLFKKSRK